MTFFRGWFIRVRMGKSWLDIKDLVRESKHPRILYLTEDDFEYVRGKAHPSFRETDDDGEFIRVTTTKVRPAIRILDLSDSTFFK